MCSNFDGLLDPIRFADTFGAAMPNGGRGSVWPAYPSSFVLQDKASPANNQRVARVGKFGMVPQWAAKDAKYAKLGLKTYNARVETVAEKPTYRDAWRQALHCIVPAEARYEPDWRNGKAVPARIARADGQPLGIAGLWTQTVDSDGVIGYSFTMLTINADGHAVFQNFHRPADEKRMVVMLQPTQFDDWLNATAKDSMAFMQRFPAEDLTVSYVNTPKPNQASVL